jgi:plastocyanin
MAHEGQIDVQVNGVALDSSAIHFEDSKTYVEVGAYTTLVGETSTYDASSETVTVNGEDFSAEVVNGKPFLHLRSIADATGAEKISWDGHTSTVYVLDLPDNYIQLSPVVAGMGEHWANPEDPTKPILGIYKGKLVFIEHIIPKAAFEAGTSFSDVPFLQGKPSPAIDHVDIEYLANGLPIPGLDGVPLYAPHYYVVSHEEHLMYGMDDHAHHDGEDMAHEFQVESVQVVDATTVKVKFNEKVADHTTNLEHNHFSIEHRAEDGSVKHYHNPSAVSLNVVKQTATLTIDPALHENVDLHLVIKGVKSADGDTLETTEVVNFVDSTIIDIRDFVFDEAEITIKKGTKVTWVNNDTAPHTVTDFDGGFDSGNLMPGDSWSFTFNDLGTFEYFCHHHPEMVAKITVVEEIN